MEWMADHHKTEVKQNKKLTKAQKQANEVGTLQALEILRENGFSVRHFLFLREITPNMIMIK